ncbi:hypothetical protein QYM36_005324 [Artemia franciscana]|uniref:Uncharacterized protein n=1 Tax=Artemia franciscana TaxID=6661 RepID=A0AA88I1R1_ARTSF|nr:hypothetical protein QYM36_005324 [Artemia franciscana]
MYTLLLTLTASIPEIRLKYKLLLLVGTLDLKADVRLEMGNSIPSAIEQSSRGRKYRTDIGLDFGLDWGKGQVKAEPRRST